MVIPRARSSGALSICSNGVKSAHPFSASVLVIAAVSVVLPWSTWPIVPTLTCGLVRSNFCFAMDLVLLLNQVTASRRAVTGDRKRIPVTALCNLSAPFGDNLLCQVIGQRLVISELHRRRRAPLGRR